MPTDTRQPTKASPSLSPLPHAGEVDGRASDRRGRAATKASCVNPSPSHRAGRDGPLPLPRSGRGEEHHLPRNAASTPAASSLATSPCLRNRVIEKNPCSVPGKFEYVTF